MLSFEITLNDQRLCTAGLYASGGIHAMVSVSQYEHTKNKPAAGDLSVSGLIGDERVTWVDGWGKLRVGDVVSVKIVDAAEPDSPRRLELRVNDTDESHLGPLQSGGQCAFCSKRQSEVQRLVNLGVPDLICDQCIREAVGYLREEGIDVCEPGSTA